MASVDEIWLTDFGDPYPGEPSARRPALVIGPPDHFGASFPFRLVVPLTSTQRNLPIHIEVESTPVTGLDVTSYAQCELMRSVNSRRLVHRLGIVGPEVSSQIGFIISTLIPGVAPFRR